MPAGAAPNHGPAQVPELRQADAPVCSSARVKLTWSDPTALRHRGVVILKLDDLPYSELTFELVDTAVRFANSFTRSWTTPSSQAMWSTSSQAT